jgi:hypothetical protein
VKKPEAQGLNSYTSAGIFFGETPNHAAFYNSVAITLKMEAREPLGFDPSRQVIVISKVQIHLPRAV